MGPNDHFDETAFNVLLLDDATPPSVAYVASIRDPQPATYSNPVYNYRRSFGLGLIAGLVLFILWQLW